MRGHRCSQRPLWTQRVQHGATPYAVKFAAAFLKNVGYQKVVLKSDGEHSIVALKEAAAREAAIESMPEESPVGDHQANGLAENAIREVKRQIRVLRSAFEESIGRVLSDEYPVLAWLPRQAADLLCRYKEGTDGRTSEVRTGIQANAECQQMGSYWMGSTERNTLRIDCPTKPAVGERFVGEDRLVVPPPPPEERAAPPQRRIYIRKEDVHKHGATEGCPGCQCVLEDRRTTAPHTEACRARIIEAMEKDEAGAGRLQTHAKKRREAQATERPKPRVVSTGEQDMCVEDAAGTPEQAVVSTAAPEGALPEPPEDPAERAELKRQAMPAPSYATPQAKPAPAQGVKRTAEEGTEALEERTTAERAVVSTATPESAVTVPEAPEAAQDLRSAVLTELKAVAMENIKSLVEETYKQNNIGITAQEISDTELRNGSH
eukprot:s680_g20.t1